MTDENDLAPEVVERLANLDDRLRRGDVSAASLDDELTSVFGPDAELADLVGCLKTLERRWPRSAPPGSVASLPNSNAQPTHLHPALSLALAQGDDLPRFGRFIIKSELGRGGFGVVFLAEDTVLRRHVALKVPRPELLLDSATRRRFLQEAKAAAAIDHPHVAPIYEAGEVGSLCYLAAAYCPGVTLAAWLAQRSTPPPSRQAARLVESLALALQCIHEQGILHRDLKPGNVLLWPSPEPAGPDELPFVPKLTDFGLSKVLAENIAESRSSVLMGTPLYMAPEQAEGRLAEIGPATDVFALGVILYELLTGQLPFSSAIMVEVFDKIRQAEPPPMRKLRGDLPRDLETICLKCLQKRPEDRYASALALAEDLQRFLEGREVVARPTTPFTRVHRWCQQAQRIPEAGLTVIGVNLVIPAGMALSLLMVQAGDVIQRPADFSLAKWYPALLTIILSSHAPMVIVGRLLMAGHQWATWLSLLVGAVMTIVSVLFMTGHIPMGTTGWDQIPGFRILYPLVVPLVLLQTLMSAIALIALRRAKQDRVS
jgi:hypothetical protein